MPVHPYQGRWPTLGARAFLAPGAHVCGDVDLGDDVSFWFHTVARGDVNTIRIGARTNIQDGTVLHVTHVRHPLVIGAGVVVGHQAVLHGCTIEDGALIGIGARVLDGAIVERGAQVGAGAVVAPGHRIQAGHLALGIPARVARPLTEEETRRIAGTCDRYAALKEEYRRNLGSGTERVPGAPAGPDHEEERR
jgi:carbonic anhydrase/acetyltransferase-like protein (isoleucine patch superfamily)